MWDALSPLIWQNLGQGWSETIHAVEASNWGLGHCSSHLDREQVKRLGQCAEKWRYGNESHVKARDSLAQVSIDSHSPIEPLLHEACPSSIHSNHESHKSTEDEFDKVLQRA